MYTGQVDVISSKATWASDVYDLVDEEDGTTTDLSTVTPLAIVVTISELINNCCGSALATASIANGKVTVPGPGFQWQFEVSDLTNLCAGTYRCGVKITLEDDFVIDLIIGDVAVLEGN